MKSLFAALALVSLMGCETKDQHTLTLIHDGHTLTLTNAACNPTVFEAQYQKFAPRFKDASAIVHGQTIAACWLMQDPETVFVRFADGSRTIIALSRFLKTDTGSKPVIDNWKNNS